MKSSTTQAFLISIVSTQIFVIAYDSPIAHATRNDLAGPTSGTQNLFPHQTIDPSIGQDLRSADAGVRRQAVLRLAHLESAEALRLLQEASHDQAPEVRSAVLRVTTSWTQNLIFTQGIVSYLLSDEDAAVRHNAALTVAAYQGSPAFFRLISTAASSPDPQVAMIAQSMTQRASSLMNVTQPNFGMMGNAGMGFAGMHLGPSPFMTGFGGAGVGGMPPAAMGMGGVGLGGTGSAMPSMWGLGGIGLGGTTIGGLNPDLTEAPGTPTRANRQNRRSRERSDAIDLPVTAGVIPESRAEVLAEPVMVRPDIAELHRTSAERLRNRMGRDYVSSDRFHLNDDYESAQVVLREVKSREPRPNQYQINYDFIAEDPYFHRHSADIHQLYPDTIDDREWLEMRNSLKQFPEVAELGHGLDRIFEKANIFEHDTRRETKTKQTIRKRVKRLYVKAQEQERAGQAGRSAASPLGDLSLALLANDERCIDGLQAGLSALEREHFSEGEAESSGDFISRVFADYRMAFIEKHAELNPSSSEFQTTVVQNLRQRMLYPLGLRGNEAEVAYPGLGSPNAPELQPARVMARFLGGERSRLGEGPYVEFPAFTVDRMIRLLQASRERSFLNPAGIAPLHPDHSGIKLKDSFIQTMVQEDETLSEAYSDFMMNPAEPNAYFAPPPAGEFAGNYRLKDRFWLRFLESNGYIKR